VTTVLNPGHDDRVVVRMLVGGRDVIRKRYADDSAEAVHQAMSDLWASPFGATRACPGLPEPLGCDAATRTLDMSIVDGPPLGRRGSVGQTPELIEAVAALVGDLHSSGVTVTRQRNPEALVAWLGRRLPYDPQGIVPRIAASAPRSVDLCLSHGDLSPRNVIVTADGPTLIDFDRLQMASCSRDVSYMGAWCWVTSMLDGSRCAADAWDLGDRFEAAYLAHRPAAEGDLLTGRRFHRAIGMVRIATEWSSMRNDAESRSLVLAEAVRTAEP